MAFRIKRAGVGCARWRTRLGRLRQRFYANTNTDRRTKPYTAVAYTKAAEYHTVIDHHRWEEKSLEAMIFPSSFPPPRR
ncbi:hypothetical protein BN1044_03988 [Hafnia alvei]|uniref:Uncharacterized protein n=1 Tax=Hafnia alvei TaxID=569 RepID=A0A1C6Z5W6_HAFAL|nr:hypothetical protein BN1044_03988 [Hafnia alvei]